MAASKKFTVAADLFMSVANNIPGIVLDNTKVAWLKYTGPGQGAVYVARTPNVRAVHVSGFEASHPRLIAAPFVNGNVKQVINFDQASELSADATEELHYREQECLDAFETSLIALLDVPPKAVKSPAKSPASQVAASATEVAMKQLQVAADLAAKRGL